MVPNLVLCAGCRRHFRPLDPVCPFCGTSVGEASARRIPALASGASRSRRYAASAALLAGGAVFACSSGSNDDPGSGKGNDTGGVTSAGQGQGGRASGGRDSSGGKNSGGMNMTASGGDGGSEQVEGGAEASGGASSGSGSGGGETEPNGGKSSTGGVTASGGTQSGRACEGFTDREGCRTAADCKPLPGTAEPPTCVMTLPARGCGNPTFLPVCPDAGCPDGQVCRPLECGESCQPECSDSNCSGTNECVDGECRPKPCDEGGENCADGYECDPAATAFPTHCAPIACSDGQECDSWRSCGEGAPRDAHGCGPKACTTDTDCGDCGYCVNAACEPTLGLCNQFLAMPYGCVWPDEELL
jgi:hypothetical protein